MANKNNTHTLVMHICTTEDYIATKLESMEKKFVGEFGVRRETLDHIHALRQVSGVSLTQWALKLHDKRDDEILTQLLMYCEIPQKRQGEFRRMVCTYLNCFRDSTWSLLETNKK